MTFHKTCRALKPDDQTILAKMIATVDGDISIPIVFAMDALAAGSETTGLQSIFLLYHMARNPDKQEKLYQEICQHIGPHGHLTETSLSKMKYTKACQMEVMRINPVSGGSMRLLNRDTTIGGYQVYNCLVS